MEHYVKFAVWWTGLGILSSVGVGFGIQTGILFLLPHIIKVLYLFAVSLSKGTVSILFFVKHGVGLFFSFLL